MMSLSLLPYIFIVILFSASPGGCIKCYTCARCGDKEVKTAGHMECPTGKCSKADFAFFGYRRNLYRGCGPCIVDHQNAQCTECKKEMCNKSSHTVPAVAVVFTIMIMAAWLM